MEGKMEVIGIPQNGATHMHKRGCKDIGKNYSGLAYDDVLHEDIESKNQTSATNPEWFPCTKTLPKYRWHDEIGG
jgi:hypothetical protein